MSEHLRTLPVHQSLIRPVLLLGAERELVLLTAVVAAVLVLSLERLFFALLGIGLWIVGLAALQRTAKIDPLLSRVYLRHIRYRAFYEAQSRVSARLTEIREQLPC